MLGILEQAFDWLKDYSSSPWFYVVLLTIAFLDSVFPIVPSETMVIIGGVSAGLHDLHWSLVILFAAVGAFSGDNFSYHIGVFFSERLQRRYNKNDKGRQRLQWAHNQIETRGGELLVTARFIPGGRTILTLSCGITRQERRWYMSWIAAAATIWALYASLLGFIGGKTFEENHTLAFIVAFVTAVSVTILIEIIRAVLKKIRTRTS